MNREVHVRICEGRGGRFPPATRRLVSATRRTTVHCAHHDRDGAAPMVIVVRLVSATRRTTVLYAHHDRDGRPATKGARRTSGRQPVTPHELPVATTLAAPRQAGWRRSSVSREFHRVGQPRNYPLGPEAHRRCLR